MANLKSSFPARRAAALKGIKKPARAYAPKVKPDVIRNPTSAQAEAIQRQQDERRHQPVAMAALARSEEATRLIFLGLFQHYTDCLLAHRLEVWRTAAIAAVNLLADPAVPLAKRKDLP